MGKLHKMSVGNAELVALQDSWIMLPPGELFDAVEEGEWSAYPQYLSPEGHLTLSLTTWLIRSEGRTILVDTGLGGRPSDFPVIDTPALPSVLEEAGASPEEVDVVVFTHLHFDHTGWNTVDRGGKPAPLFPNARHLIQQAEWDYWTTGSPENGSDQATVLDPLVEAGLVDFVEGEHPVTREVVTLPTPGHTPGHVSFLLTSGGSRWWCWGMRHTRRHSSGSRTGALARTWTSRWRGGRGRRCGIGRRTREFWWRRTTSRSRGWGTRCGRTGCSAGSQFDHPLSFAAGVILQWAEASGDPRRRQVDPGW